MFSSDLTFPSLCRRLCVYIKSCLEKYLHVLGAREKAQQLKRACYFLEDQSSVPSTH